MIIISMPLKLKKNQQETLELITQKTKEKTTTKRKEANKNSFVCCFVLNT